MKQSELEESFLNQVRMFGLPEPTRQFKFHPDRKWRVDFVWEEYKIAVEVQGGIWTNGGHTRGSGYLKDCEKFNWMNRMGWCLILVPVNMVDDYTGVMFVKDMIDELS